MVEHGFRIGTVCKIVNPIDDQERLPLLLDRDDDLYGRMLLSNQHYEWAMFLFQKCSARWKYWQPQTEETARRLKLAEDEIAECNRRMTHHRR